MVHRGEGAELSQELVEQALREVRDRACNWWFVGKDHLRGDGVVGVDGKEAPVDVCAVADIRVVAFAGCFLEDGLEELLGLVALCRGLEGFEEELYDGGEDL